MIVWYFGTALTTGVIPIEVDGREPLYPSVYLRSDRICPGPERRYCRAVKEQALGEAEKMREQRIKELQAEIDRVRAMIFC